MTKQEISVFEAYEKDIVRVATQLRKAYAESHLLSAADAPDFYQMVLSEAPAALLQHYEGSWEDKNELGRFLHNHFYNKFCDVRKKAKRRLKFAAVNADDESIADELSYTMDVGEDASVLAKRAVRSLMPHVSEELQLLCKAFMKKGSWAAAGEHLGWSNGKLYREQSKLKNFFQENCKKSGEFFEVVPMKGVKAKNYA